jgi:hypothetical protein
MILLAWFAYYVVKNTVSSASSCITAYVYRSMVKRITGSFAPNLKTGKCYVILHGEVIEINNKKRYVIADGKCNESIEDNWLVI